MWNFNTMEMGFTVGKKDVQLVGIGQSEAKQVGSLTVNKTLKKSNGNGMLLQIRLVNKEDEKKEESGE